MTSPEEIRRDLNKLAAESPCAAGELAFALFTGTPPPLPVRPSERATHDRAAVDRVDVDGRSLAVYRWGDTGGRVLLLHGFEGRASNLSGFVDGIGDLGMSAVAFDFFGHGASEGDRATITDLVAALRVVDTEYGPFRAIVAHSFGALCAYEALRSGVRADRLVTIASICDFDYVPKVFCQKLGLDPRIEEDLIRRSEEFFSEDYIWERFSATYRAAELTVPLLVIHDENDKEIAVEQGRKIAAVYGQAQYIETRGLGHRRILADADVITATLEFVAQ
ncbi:alpha/beta hydrolase [Actinomadura meridiana]|uniref:Alpha/beta hydrolase n=1 Tax=Actinomadura meridiana TaxID=559626 RepID=A0ABP8BWX0_9ACTN